MKCKDCKWWSYIEILNGRDVGRCRRYPIAEKKDEADYCGEFEEKKNERAS